MVVVLAAVAGVGYFYGLPLINGALQQEPAAKSPGNSKASESGTVGGPMGDVGGAMDVSEALDSGSSGTKRRQVAATNNAAQRAVKPPH
jgi:hypothetical protein